MPAHTPFCSSQVSIARSSSPASVSPSQSLSTPSQTSTSSLGWSVKAQSPLPASHTSSVQGSPSSQFLVEPGKQAPPPHISFSVHPLLSSQGAALFTYAHFPVLGLHVSSVQPLPSSQFIAAPDWQLPPPQTSFRVHAFPSSQGAALFAYTHALVLGLHASSVHTFPSSQIPQSPPQPSSPHVRPSQSGSQSHAPLSSQNEPEYSSHSGQSNVPPHPSSHDPQS